MRVFGVLQGQLCNRKLRLVWVIVGRQIPLYPFSDDLRVGYRLLVRQRISKRIDHFLVLAQRQDTNPLADESEKLVVAGITRHRFQVRSPNVKI